MYVSVLCLILGTAGRSTEDRVAEAMQQCNRDLELCRSTERWETFINIAMGVGQFVTIGRQLYMIIVPEK